MSRSYDLMKSITHMEERLDEDEMNLLSLLNELEEALEEEGQSEVWTRDDWKGYRNRQHEKVYGEPYEDEEKEDND